MQLYFPQAFKRYQRYINQSIFNSTYRASLIFNARKAELEQSVCTATQLYLLIRVKLDHILWEKYFLVFSLMSSSCSV